MVIRRDYTLFISKPEERAPLLRPAGAGEACVGSLERRAAVPVCVYVGRGRGEVSANAITCSTFAAVLQ